MLDLLIDLLATTIPQTTGRVIVYALSFGKVHATDDVCYWIGVVFWIVFVGSTAGLVIWRRF